MIPAIDDYLRRLERELREHGLEGQRILEEAREHLVDAVDAGRHRGLSDADAEREALERFGPPEAIAEHMLSERDRIMTRLVAALETVWQRKWWILAPTLLAAVVTSVTSYYFLPTRYRAEATILVVPQQVPDEYVHSTLLTPIGDRLRSIRQQLLSRSRLERIIMEFNLYGVERKTSPRIEVIDRMARDIDVSILPAEGMKGADAFRVSFVSSDPKTARQVTEKLASFFIDESVRDRAQLSAQTTDFIESRIAEVRRRIIEYEKTLKDLKAQNGGQPLSQADVLPYEVLQDSYRTLLVKFEEARIAANVEQRQIGEQFRVIEQARVPERPDGPDRLSVNAAGTFGGFAFGLVCLRFQRKSKNES